MLVMLATQVMAFVFLISYWFLSCKLIRGYFSVAKLPKSPG